MGMPLEMNWIIVTKSKEEKIPETNCYRLTKSGYRLYPLDVENVEVRREKNSNIIGFAVVKELKLQNGETTIVFELKKLNGVN